jgi:endonuclease V-like protein UPF0215 family
VKPGVRALGVAESYRGRDRSTLAGAVVRADRVVDGFSFRDCTVGGTDATAAVVDLVDREDVRHVLLAGIALAWYNLVDLRAVAAAVERPVVSVTFEESDGLETGLREAFDGDALAARLATYRALPPRRPVDVGDERVFVRAAGCEAATAAAVVRAHTPSGGRPEPLRVARLAARGADRWRRPEG